jgi:DNA-binding CsgD family transcriptional regulator
MVDDRHLLQFYVRLTSRQREVLQLVSTGLSNQEVANRLFIAASVVAGHLTNIYDEMGVLKQFSDKRPNRYTAIRLFNSFFDRYPELDNFRSINPGQHKHEHQASRPVRTLNSLYPKNRLIDM